MTISETSGFLKTYETYDKKEGKNTISISISWKKESLSSLTSVKFSQEFS